MAGTTSHTCNIEVTYIMLPGGPCISELTDDLCWGHPNV
ncbi:hypothetical protein EV146_11623 [Mesobacillus foraminis]|uniref:Uncharacterized protein n=1 Tax=Mesobacillus foraminis TaxID=279826 RepID=A0A4R2B077_9BACI|nr:hypothetical protein EV146_11623 [Mesobacillus foraminis]